MQRSFTPNRRVVSLTSEIRQRDVRSADAHRPLPERDDVACRGTLYAARLWTILVEREMDSGPVMILKIARQDRISAKVLADIAQDRYWAETGASSSVYGGADVRALFRPDERTS